MTSQAKLIGFGLHMIPVSIRRDLEATGSHERAAAEQCTEAGCMSLPGPSFSDAFLPKCESGRSCPLRPSLRMGLHTVPVVQAFHFRKLLQKVHVGSKRLLAPRACESCGDAWQLT